MLVNKLHAKDAEVIREMMDHIAAMVCQEIDAYVDFLDRDPEQQEQILRANPISIKICGACGGLSQRIVIGTPPQPVEINGQTVA